MTDGSKKGTSFCVRMWLKQIGKNVCRKLLFESKKGTSFFCAKMWLKWFGKNRLQEIVVRKKCLQRCIKKVCRSFIPHLQENNGLSPSNKQGGADGMRNIISLISSVSSFWPWSEKMRDPGNEVEVLEMLFELNWKPIYQETVDCTKILQRTAATTDTSLSYRNDNINNDA